jgi:glycosyltransferase involved in cell wall biosynthesis
MSAAAPLVSVIIASFNGERFIEATVRSVLAQTFKNYELIIADDGSDAPTRQLLTRLGAEDARIRILNLDHAGLVATLNRAIAAARGRYIARLDHDDLSLPTRLAEQAAWLETNPHAVAVGCGIGAIDADGRLVKAEYARGRMRAHRPTAFPPEPMWMSGSTVMARANVLRAIGGYRAACLAAEDRDVSWRLAAAGPTKRLRPVLVHWREHGANTSVTKRRIQLASHIISDLSAIARHFRCDDTAIIEGVEVGGEYAPIVRQYAQLIGGRYPVETYWYYFLVRNDIWQLSGAPTRDAFMAEVWRHVRARPSEWPRLKLAHRAWKTARRQALPPMTAESGARGEVER